MKYQLKAVSLNDNGGLIKAFIRATHGSVTYAICPYGKDRYQLEYMYPDMYITKNYDGNTLQQVDYDVILFNMIYPNEITQVEKFVSYKRPKLIIIATDTDVTRVGMNRNETMHMIKYVEEELGYVIMGVQTYNDYPVSYKLSKSMITTNTRWFGLPMDQETSFFICYDKNRYNQHIYDIRIESVPKRNTNEYKVKKSLVQIIDPMSYDERLYFPKGYMDRVKWKERNRKNRNGITICNYLDYIPFPSYSQYTDNVDHIVVKSSSAIAQKTVFNKEINTDYYRKISPNELAEILGLKNYGPEDWEWHKKLTIDRQYEFLERALNVPCCESIIRSVMKRFLRYDEENRIADDI